jgi:Ca-activated chloride channel family protein
MKRTIWSLLSVLAVVFGLSFSEGFSAGLIIVDESHWLPSPPAPGPDIRPWPRPMPPRFRPHVFSPLEVASVKANTKITDQIAVTTIDEEFYNPNPARLEGTFVFPLPKGAHVDKFAMEIDGHSVQAELLSADKARHIYEDIVRRAKDPALMEYAGRDIFKVRIFPIEPNSRKRITLSYTELLKSDSGLIGYVLPLNTEKFSSKPIHNLSAKIELETKRPIKSIYSPTHSVDIKRHGSTSATARYEATDVQPDSDLALYFAPEKDEIGLNLLTHRNSGEDGYFLLLASPGIDVKEKQVVLKDVVFVLDTSGSMAGKKIEQAKKALLFCVNNLNEGDRFEIMRFSTEVEPLFNKLADATTANRSKAEEFIKDLKAIGGTAIDDALRQALELKAGHSRDSDRGDRDGESTTRKDRSRPFVVIFLTDGCPTIGVTSEDEIAANAKRRAQGETRVFCFGIGSDVNTRLLDRIAQDTHAFSQYVLPDEDLEVKLSSFYSKIKDPVLAHPKLDFTGDIHASQLYPSPLPDLFKGEQLVLVGRYSGKGDSAITISGEVNGDTKKFTYETKFPGEATDNDFIPRLWAMRRVGYLLDEIRLHGESSELRDEATQLARKYDIVTPYTAYLIMEDESRRGVTMTTRSFQDFGQDVQARNEAELNWHSFKTETTGDAAAFRSRYGLALQQAQSPAPAATASAAEAQRSLSSSSPSSGQADARFRARYGLGPANTNFAFNGGVDDSKARLVEYSRQSKFVSGKTFFLNQTKWIDSAVQSAPKAKHVRVPLGSPEYFELAAKGPNVSAWLALGSNLQFLLGDTVYEIYE